MSGGGEGGGSSVPLTCLGVCRSLREEVGGVANPRCVCKQACGKTLCGERAGTGASPTTG